MTLSVITHVSSGPRVEGPVSFLTLRHVGRAGAAFANSARDQHTRYNASDNGAAAEAPIIAAIVSILSVAILPEPVLPVTGLAVTVLTLNKAAIADTAINNLR